MDELKSKLIMLEQLLMRKQKEINELKLEIKDITASIQNQCPHSNKTKMYQFDGHKSFYIITCHDCYKTL
jgi:hypothetical protein